jgi:nucleotide-binding universal stress UspA family protein
MMNMTSIQDFKIIWAVDPEEGMGVTNGAMNAIRLLVKGTPAITIEPVYIVSTLLASTPTQTSGESLSLDRLAAVDRFKKLIGKNQPSGLLPIAMLYGTALSKRMMALKLSEYAKQREADVIVVATHGESGIKRWLLGSFAELLIELSNTPLFIVNPDLINPRQTAAVEFKTILFPTDFSERSKEAYLKAVDLAEKSKSKIRILHNLSLTLTPERPWLPSDSKYQQMIDKKIADAQESAASWVVDGKKQGVEVSLTIDAENRPSVAESILENHKTFGGIIALASQSGETSTHRQGRTAIEVVGRSTTPVWVIYPATSVSKRSLRAA